MWIYLGKSNLGYLYVRRDYQSAYLYRKRDWKSPTTYLGVLTRSLINRLNIRGPALAKLRELLRPKIDFKRLAEDLEYAKDVMHIIGSLMEYLDYLPKAVKSKAIAKFENALEKLTRRWKLSDITTPAGLIEDVVTKLEADLELLKYV